MSFFELSPMGGMSMGGMYLGGAKKGEKLSEDVKARIKATKLANSAKVEARAEQLYEEAFQSGQKISMKDALKIAKAETGVGKRAKLTPEEKRTRALARLEPDYTPRPRRAPKAGGVAEKKRLLKDKLFGVATAKRTPVGWSDARKAQGKLGNLSMEQLDEILAFAESKGWGAEVDEMVGSGLWDTLAKGIMTVAPMLI